jgi:glycosyltransferase involved in cell wall biosynthesis
MKVSIITVCYNSAATLEETIQSVLSQDYPEIEYILVDGLSKDSTPEIINKYRDKISIIVSEKDKGLYDALNKGIALATGEVIGLLHSDDVYFGTRVISNIIKLFKEQHTDGVYADLLYVDKFDLNKISRYWKSKPYKQGMFKKGWMPPHPTFFVKKAIYSNLGGFNLDLKSAADYELMLRFIHKHKITVSYLPEVIIRMRTGGKSNLSFLNRLRGNREDKMAWKINGLKPGLFTLIRKPLSKLGQFYKKFSGK